MNLRFLSRKKLIIWLIYTSFNMYFSRRKVPKVFFFCLASWILRSISPFKSYRIEISLRSPILFNAFFKGLTLGFFIMALLFYFIYYLMPWLIEPIETSIWFLSILNTLFSNKEIPPVVGMTHRLSFWSKR